MATLREWLRRVWGAFRRSPGDAQIEEELRLHLELASQAGRAGRVRAGGVAQAMDAMRDQRGWPWLDDLRCDVRHAVRMLRRNPAFTIAALLTLALGIGANSALFAIADAALLRPLPFPEADRLVMIKEIRSGGPVNIVGPYEVVDWVDRNRTFESMAGIWLNKRVMTVGDGAGEQVVIQSVSARFFDVFRVIPIAGRTFQPPDDRP